MSNPTLLKPIQVWGEGPPNPSKVATILKELDIPHEFISITFADVKKPEYVAINPNGRLPAIHDPNTNLTLWESGAIILYLLEQYDPDHKISFPSGSPEAHLAQQWLFFQTTGQGPYYGQAVFFKIYHTEKVDSVVQRFLKEALRVTGVLEAHLAGQREKYGQEAGGPWLVGNKYSYADMAFVSWQRTLAKVVSVEEGLDFGAFPLVEAWVSRMEKREAVQYGMAGSHA